MNYLISAAIIAITIQIIIFLIAFLKKTDKYTDITYALTFIILISIPFYKNQNLTSLILFSVILLWAIRLGTYLTIRIIKTKKDDRFDKIRSKPIKLLVFWLMQGFSVWIILMPSLLILEKEKVFHLSSISGLLIAIIALIIETVADLQKYKFKQKNKDKWISTGLWKYSRHPNYFGEILFWIGVYIYCLPYLDVLLKVVCLISPLYIYLLIRYVTGIPLLEKSADKKWIKNKEYQKYKKETPILLPIKIK